MKKTEVFELKLADGSTVKWEGESGEHAARRYVDLHPGAVVFAWRYPRYEFKPGMIRIID